MEDVYYYNPVTGNYFVSNRAKGIISKKIKKQEYEAGIAQAKQASNTQTVVKKEVTLTEKQLNLIKQILEHYSINDEINVKSFCSKSGLNPITVGSLIGTIKEKHLINVVVKNGEKHFTFNEQGKSLIQGG